MKTLVFRLASAMLTASCISTIQAQIAEPTPTINNGSLNVGIGTSQGSPKLWVLSNTAFGNNILSTHLITTTPGNNQAFGIQDISTATANMGELNALRGDAICNAGSTIGAVMGVRGNCLAGTGTVALGYGLYGKSDNGATRYGVAGFAITGGTKANYGVYGSAANAVDADIARPNYGLYGTAPTATGWAVYSNGNQFSTSMSTWSTSDARLKNNIEPLTGALSVLLQLRPKTYTYNTSLHPGFNLPEGQQMGLISQEVEKILPTLVMNMHNPAAHDGEGKEIDPGFDFKAMSYTGLIPVLVSGIQEQQAIIDTQKERIEALEADMAELKALLTAANVGTISSNMPKAHLEQNAPNPFNENTVIRFYIPVTAKSASIEVNGTDGKALKSFNALSGQNQLVIGAGSMSEGTYTYTLIVDGEKVDSKTMVITR